MNGASIVCAEHETKLNPRLIGPILQEYCGLLRQDAMVQVSRGMGVLAADISADCAAALVEELAENGVQAFAVAQSRVPELGPPAKLHRVVDVRDDGLVLQLTPGAEPQPVPWSALVVGASTQPMTAAKTNVTKVNENVCVGHGRSVNVTMTKRSMVQPAKWSADFVLCNRQGAVKAFGVTEKNVQFSYMGERALTLAELNFPLFLADMASHARNAFLTEGFQAAARGDRLRVTRVASSRHRENLVKWALCCAAHKGYLD